MMSTNGLRLIDETLRYVTGNIGPFGGKVIVFGGDFRQLLPVVQYGSRTQIIAESVISNKLWDRCFPVHLSENMRAQGDSAFCEWLLAVGTGQLPLADGMKNYNVIQIPDNMLLKIPDQPDSKEKPKEEEDPEEMPLAMLTMVEAIYGSSIEKMSTDDLAKRAILASTNKEVLKINNFIIKSLSPKAFTYLSYDQVISDDYSDKDNFPAEVLNSKTPSSMPPHKLTLKVGTIVMLLRNIRPKQGLSNGTRLQVVALSVNGIEARIISEKCCGQVHFLFRMDLTSNDSSLPCLMLRRQFPVIPAYAITINKSQGQTLDHAGIYINNPVFAHGQLYVALSRCRKQENIKIYIRNLEGQQGDLLNDGRTFTTNVVYRDVFRHGELKDDSTIPADNNILQDIHDFKKPALTATCSTASMRTASQVEKQQRMETSVQNTNSTVSMRTASEVDQKIKQAKSMRTVTEVEQELKQTSKKPIKPKIPKPAMIERLEQPSRPRNNKFVLFTNTIYINVPRQKKIYNMCMHNSIAQGLICLMKINPTVQKYISDISPLCEYFRILIAATYEEDSVVRNEYWGNFILSKLKIIPDDGDMAGDIAEVIVDTLEGHTSITNVSDYGSVQHSALEVTVKNHGGLTNFPQNILNVLQESGKNSKTTFHDLLFIAPSNFQTVLSCISESFEHSKETYRLQMIVNFEGEVNFIEEKECSTKKTAQSQAAAAAMLDSIQFDGKKKTGHYTTYVKDYQNNKWWVLDDLANKEMIATDMNTKDFTVSLMVFARQSADCKPDSDVKMESDSEDDDDDDAFEINESDKEEIIYDSNESDISFNEEDCEINVVDRSHELSFSNRMKIIDSKLKEPIEITNMCPHNSVGHGFIFQYKNDPDVCRYIQKMAKHSKYFQTILDVVDQRCKSFKNTIWGNFIKYKAMHSESNRLADMTGNPSHMLEFTMANHTSFFKNARPMKYLTLSERCTTLKFPDVLLAAIGKNKAIFKEILIIDCSDFKICLDKIQLTFQHNNEEYFFKFLVEFDGIKFTRNPNNHFRTYAYHEQQHEWWILDDNKTEEILLSEPQKTTVMVSLMVYGKHVPKNFEPSLQPSHPSYEVENSSEESEVYMSEEEDDDDEVILIEDENN